MGDGSIPDCRAIRTLPSHATFRIGSGAARGDAATAGAPELRAWLAEHVGVPQRCLGVGKRP
jgi:hypothetical protein